MTAYTVASLVFACIACAFVGFVIGYELGAKWGAWRYGWKR